MPHSAEQRLNITRATLLVVVLTTVGCTDAPISLAEPPGPRRVVAEEIEWTYVDGHMDAISEPESVEGSFPEWDGIDPAYSALPDGQTYSCPAVGASVMVIGSDKGTFIVAGIFSLVSRHAGTRHGFPHARYSVPNTTHYNIEGTYYIHGGYVDVTCRGRFFTVGGIRRWIGDLHPYAYYGAGGPVSRGASNYSGQGWAYQNTANQFSSGSQNSQGDWANVLKKYLETGECTPGWAIVVDGVKVCNG